MKPKQANHTRKTSGRPADPRCLQSRGRVGKEGLGDGVGIESSSANGRGA